MQRHILALFLVAAALAGCAGGAPDLSPGVSAALARQRSRILANVRYEIALTVPAASQEALDGRATVRFVLRDPTQPVVLDFTGPEAGVRRVTANGDSVPYEVTNGHVVIPAAALMPGENAVELRFRPGDGALNRNPEYLYTLFVPDRASSAFPCFDQPDLKARYRLTLDVPSGWAAVANAPSIARDSLGTRTRVRFAETQPLSTYLFAFATGRFQVERAVRDDRVLRLYHRETDTAKVRRNLDAIFDLQAQALAWLEEYSGITYPFEKFDFVAVPAFQYGGMEHPGAVLYRAATLFLEEAATQNERLGRASLIAHETAHMWFGDLVTMGWFDDVWMKEVFANFLAAKIVNPAFPDVDHDLRFFLAHHPTAYAVDRTAGANPIRQELANLNEAGSLYGAIIYQKAPIVMRQLERLVGEAPFREGLREYLTRFRFGNATWRDLIAILDRRAPEDLAAWSAAWVEAPGRPTVHARVRTAGDTIAHLSLAASDPRGRDLVWAQHLEVALGYRDSLVRFPVRLGRGAADVTAASGLPAPAFVLAGAGGLGYGRFTLDERSRDYLVRHAHEIADPVPRAVAWSHLWEAVLAREVAPAALAELVLAALPTEANELVLDAVLGYGDRLFWRHLTAAERAALGPRFETALWNGVVGGATTGAKAAYFDTYVAVATSEESVERLAQLWRGDLTIPRLPLSERHHSRLAQALALRGAPDAARVLAEQLGRIENPDRRAQFAFVVPALSPDIVVRDSVFVSLADEANREHEPWVLDAVASLHHPLRAAHAERYIRPSLELLPEIQRTGDIFFPLRWLHATLDGHNSSSAAGIVRQFLDDHPAYPPRLRAKILQAADPLFRAAARGGVDTALAPTY